jgi:hypothetical protein
MSNQEAFETALDKTADYVEGIGDEVVEENVDSIIEGLVRGEHYSLTGHRCRSNVESTYLVAGHPEFRFFSVTYFFSLNEYVGSQLPNEILDEIIDQVANEPEQTGTGSKHRIAGRELLNDVSEQDMAALESYLFMFISGGTNVTHIQTADSGAVTGFVVSTDCFPFEEAFSIRDFSDAVKRTVTGGRRGNKLVERTVFVEPDEKKELEARVKLNFGW